MEITWYGQSAFRVAIDGAVILFDPFLTGNPSWNKGWQEAAEGVTHLLLTHGHGDHLGDSVEILKNTNAKAVATAELATYLAGKGVPEDRVEAGNTGGTVDCGAFTVTFVQALHSSSFTEDGTNLYLGNPNGLVVHSPDAPTLLHMGDTDIFGDMALIHELHQPKIGIVPVGDRYTMGGAVAALACRRFFAFETVIPCHYGTFPVLDRTAEKFIDGMDGSGVKVLVPQIGEETRI